MRLGLLGISVAAAIVASASITASAEPPPMPPAAAASTAVVSPPTATVVGVVSVQAYSSPTDSSLYVIPAGQTARLNQVIVWGGSLAAGKICGIFVYCSTTGTGGPLYLMPDPGKSTTHTLTPELQCKGPAQIRSYTFKAPAYVNGCDGGLSRPFLEIRGTLVQ